MEGKKAGRKKRGFFKIGKADYSPPKNRRDIHTYNIRHYLGSLPSRLGGDEIFYWFRDCEMGHVYYIPFSDELRWPGRFTLL